MKILIISRGYPSQGYPRFGNFERDQALALAKKGHTVIFAYVDFRLRVLRRRIGISKREESGITIYSLFLLPIVLLFFPKLKSVVREKLMQKLIEHVVKEEGSPSVIYSHYLFMAAQLGPIKEKFPNIPIVALEHWSMLSQDRLQKDVFEQGKIAYSIPDRQLAVSPALQANIKRHFGKDSIVLNNMVDDLFLNTSRQSEQRHNVFKFISVGSLIPTKGYDVLVKAFAQVRSHDTTLEIIGNGPEKRSLNRLIKDLKIENRVKLLGEMDRESIASYLSSSDAFVLATRSETFGVVFIEAMAEGLPVIGTVCGGPEQFVSDQCGILVPVDDTAALAKAMETMVAEYDKYEPAFIKEYTRSRFSSDTIMNQLICIFEKVIEEKQASMNRKLINR